MNNPISSINACVEVLAQKAFAEARKAIMSGVNALEAALKIKAAKAAIQAALKGMIPEIPIGLANFATELIRLAAIPPEQYAAEAAKFIARWIQVIPGVAEIVKAIDDFNPCSASNVFAAKIDSAGNVIATRVKSFETQMATGETPKPLDKVGADVKTLPDMITDYALTNDAYQEFSANLASLIAQTRKASKMDRLSPEVLRNVRSIAEDARARGLNSARYTKEYSNAIDPALLKDYLASKDSEYATIQANLVTSNLTTIAAAFRNKVGRSEYGSDVSTLRAEYDASIEHFGRTLSDSTSLLSLDLVAKPIGDLIVKNAEVIRDHYQFGTSNGAGDGPGVLPSRDDLPVATEGDALIDVSDQGLPNVLPPMPDLNAPTEGDAPLNLPLPESVIP
jgi:hypothetical protein